MSDPKGIMPLKQYLESIQGTKPEEFAGAEKRAAKADAVAEMRTHILRHYEGVESQGSYRDANGSIFDCVPIEQQPSLRGSKEGVPKAPELPTLKEQRAGGEKNDNKAQMMEAPLGEGKKDDQGNAMHCPEGTIPMRRLRLEDMARFDSLQSFFRKNPVGQEMTPPKEAPQGANVTATHRWAHAFQNINALGGHSFINVWQPGIGANQIFSLSQHWYVGGSTAGTQTAEVGWQVYPGLYGGASPCLFIYWTADGYNKTGCYNLSCKAFTQTNSAWHLGGALAPVSAYGGAQWELETAFYLNGGRWWLYLKGGASSNAIGFYPASQYGSGNMATHCTEIDYGGETVGTTSWPGMGSSHFANQGWTKAAYHRNVLAYPTGGGAVDASLAPSQSWPNCYTAQVVKYAPTWSETLWFGGPGGVC